MKGLVAVPVHNEAANLPAVIKELANVIPTQNTLFVDDGSTDDSNKILRQAGVQLITHTKNLGYLGALRAAMSFMLAGVWEYIVFFDADGQHRTGDLIRIIDSWEKDPCDLLIGSRYIQTAAHGSPLRLIGTQVFSRIAGMLSGTKITDATSGMKLVSRRFVPVALELPAVDLHAELITGLAQAGARIREIPIDVRPRNAGTSMYGAGRSLYYPVATLLCIVRILMSKPLKP